MSTRVVLFVVVRTPPTTSILPLIRHGICGAATTTSALLIAVPTGRSAANLPTDGGLGTGRLVGLLFCHSRLWGGTRGRGPGGGWELGPVGCINQKHERLAQQNGHVAAGWTTILCQSDGRRICAKFYTARLFMRAHGTCIISKTSVDDLQSGCRTSVDKPQPWAGSAATCDGVVLHRE